MANQTTTFASSEIDDILITKQSNFVYFQKTDEKYRDMYDRFTQDFGLFLGKLPNHPAKKYVSEVFNRNLVFLGINQLTKNEGFFSKIVVENNSLSKIVLDIKDLEVDVTTGKTKNIDDCIYATYFSYLKSAVILNKTLIKKDDDLHNLLSQYLYLLVLTVLNSKATINTQKQKMFIKIICYYIFYRYYLKEKFGQTVKVLEKIFKDSKDIFEEFKPSFKEIEKYISIKDIPKILIDTNILITDPNLFIVSVVKKFKMYGFYSIFGSLDTFISYIVSSKYPFELLNINNNINTDLQNKIENLMIPYMKKVKFMK